MTRPDPGHHQDHAWPEVLDHAAGGHERKGRCVDGGWSHGIAHDARLLFIGTILGAWTHSPEERVIERFTRRSENYLTYQVTVIDPVVLERPFVSPPLTWTLAQAADDVWTEYLCTANEEPLYMEKMDPETRKLYE